MTDQTVYLPALLSPGEAVMLRNSLLAALTHGGKTILEGSAVHEISVQGLAVLLSFISTSNAIGHPWAIKAPSEEMVVALEHYGLFSDLMTWPVEM